MHNYKHCKKNSMSNLNQGTGLFKGKCKEKKKPCGCCFIWPRHGKCGTYDIHSGQLLMHVYIFLLVNGNIKVSCKQNYRDSGIEKSKKLYFQISIWNFFSYMACNAAQSKRRGQSQHAKFFSIVRRIKSSILKSNINSLKRVFL